MHNERWVAGSLGHQTGIGHHHLPQGTHRPAWYAQFFFGFYTSLWVTKQQSFRRVAGFLIFAYVLIVYVTSMNTVYFLLTYNHFQRENKCENEQNGEGELAIMGSVSTVTLTFKSSMSVSYAIVDCGDWPHDCQSTLLILLSFNMGSMDRQSQGQSP